MKEEAREREIDRIKSETDCRRGFECCGEGTEVLCNAKYIAGGAIVDCSEAGCKRKDNCTYRMAFGFGYICNCPVRKYMARHRQE